jgi:hypothetical protein
MDALPASFAIPPKQDSPLPTRTRPLTLIDEPQAANEKTLTLLPILQQFLTEMHEATCTSFITLSALTDPN